MIKQKPNTLKLFHYLMLLVSLVLVAVDSFPISTTTTNSDHNKVF